MNMDLQLRELLKKYPKLSVVKSDNEIIIQGELPFYAELNDIPIYDKYNVEIVVPKNFPFNIPLVKEIKGRIKNDLGHLFKDGYLCLGVFSEISIKLQKNQSILFFVDYFIINFLYIASYYEKYGQVPEMEREHGKKGILDFYRGYFGFNSETLILSLLDIICNNDNITTKLCPCNSTKTIEDCFHGAAVKSLNSLASLDIIKADYKELVSRSKYGS